MKNIITHQKVFLIILLTVFLVFGVQSVSDAFFWEIFGAFGEILGAIGEAIGAAGEAIGIIVNVVANAVVIAADATNLSIKLVSTAVWDTGSVSNAHAFPDGGLVGVVVSNLIYIWNPHTGQLHATLPHDALIRDIAVNPDGNILASGSMDGTLQLWNPHTETLQAVLRGDTDGGILSVAFSPDGLLLASGSADGTLQIWDPHTETVRATIKGYSNSAILSVAFSPDGSLLASGSVDGTIRLWDPYTRNLQSTIRAHRDSVLSIAFSPDGSLLASASADGTVGLWGRYTAQNEATLDHEAPVLSIAFNPDGSMLASGCVDGTARLWDPQTSNILATLGHASPVRSVVVSPDGSFLITGSEDGKARKWEITTGSGSTTTSTVTPKPGTPFTGTPASVSASTAGPLTETTLHESIVTLKLSERTYERSIFDIRDAVTVSGIDGVTIPWHQPDRKSDTEITIELEFDSNIDTDATLTFTVGAEAIANYNGPKATAQIPVTAVTESVVATTTESLAETTLDESVVTLTLSGRKYASSIFDIRDAVSVSGIDGVTIPWHQPDRKSDTQITIELEFDGNIDTDGTLTFTVGADAIAGYNGTALTAQIPVTGGQESIGASTEAPLTETTLHESVVTLTLNGAKYASSIFDIRDAVSISGIEGVTIPWHQPDRKSDTQITIELEFDGDVDTDATLIFTVGADAIAGYNGTALTAQVPVTGGQESVVASTVAPLTETTLHESIVTLTLNGAEYASSIFDIRRAVKVSGISGVTIPWHQPRRESDTQITIELEFDGDIDTDATLTFTVSADAIANYNGEALTAQVPVAGGQESVTASTAAPLTEATLDESVVTLTLSGRKYARSIFGIRDAVSVSGIDGVTMPWHQPRRESDTQITIELEFDGNMNTDGTLTFTVGANAIENYNGSALTAQVTVTADRENVLLANFPNPFNPETWIPYQLAKPTEVTITIYAVNGQVVRTLALGHQAAGIYQTRSRAAHWDGRNAFGESVASGVYFYTLTAGDFSATRKMLIRK